MKKTRIVALFLALVLTLSMFSFASAAPAKPTMSLVKTADSNRIGYKSSFYELKNGKTASFYIHADYMSSLYVGEEGRSYTDVIFDCDSAVKAKTSAKWIEIDQYKRGFNLYCQPNPTLKNRTAKITVTGKNYKATIKLTQFGGNFITSAVRNKKTVTVKFDMAASSDGGYLSISQYKDTDDGFHTSKSWSVPFEKGAKSVKFTVKAGWNYSVTLCAYYHFSESWRGSNSTHSFSFEVPSVKGKETLFPKEN